MGRIATINFDEIKSRLVKLPELHLQDNKGRFHLYSDTSKFATGSAFYQIWNTKIQVNRLCKMTRSSKKLFYHRIGNVCLSYKYINFCTPIKKSRF